MASQNGHEKIVRQLLQSGARDIPNKVGKMSSFQQCIYIETCVIHSVVQVVPIVGC